MSFSNQLNFLQKLKQLACFITLGLFVFWQLAIPFLGQQSNGQVAKTLSLLVTFSVLISVFATLVSLNKLTKQAKYFFITTVFIWLTMTAIFYPGIYNLDLARALIKASNNLTSSWVSHIYSSMLMVLHSILPNLFAINLFAIFLLLALIWRLAKNFPPTDYFNASVYILLFNFPVLHLFLNTSYRDGIAALFSALIIEILFRVYKSRELSVSNSVELCSFTTICYLIKADHFHYLFFVPLVVWFCAKNQTRLNKIIYTSVLLLLPLTVGQLYKIKNIEMNSTYKLTALWNPLNEIVYKRDAQISEQDKNTIAKIVNYDYIKNNHDPYEITGFHHAEYKRNYSQEDFDSLVKVYVSLVIQHWDIFLENRVNLFLRGNELDGKSYLYDDQIKLWDYHVSKYTSVLAVEYPTFNTNIKNSYFDFLEEHIRANKVFAATFSGTGFFIFLFLISAFLVYQNVACLLILQLVFFRFLWVFLFAPANHLKYHGHFLFPTLTIFVCSVFLFYQHRSDLKLKSQA